MIYCDIIILIELCGFLIVLSSLLHMEKMEFFKLTFFPLFSLSLIAYQECNTFLCYSFRELILEITVDLTDLSFDLFFFPLQTKFLV